MISTEPMLERWKEMAADGSAQHLLVEEHELHLYFGIDQAGLPIFFAISSLRPQLPLLRGVMTSAVRQRGDGQFVATLTLASNEYMDTFMRMCLELARRTSSELAEADALDAFVRTLKQWQRLLAHGGARPMSDRQVRGLLGELRIARSVLGQKVGARDVVASWEGPLGAPQDFRLRALGLFEIKAIRANTSSVLVSSVRQLDPSSPERLHLMTIEIAENNLETSGAAVSLLEEVESMRAFIGSDIEASEQFEDRLARLGLDTTEPRYSERYYVFGGVAAYVVDSEFPRLLQANVPLGVDEVTYRIRLDHIAPFQRSVEDALNPQNDDRLVPDV